MAPRKTPPASRRRAHLRRTFDARVGDERRRYAGEPRRILWHDLRVRFLERHLRSLRGVVLELGPGPGRFTPQLQPGPRGRVVAIDLSRESLRTARRRDRRGRRSGHIDWVQGAGECLPLRSRSTGTAVVLGNIVSFAAGDGPALLKELGRVMMRGGRLVVDFASPAASLQEFFHSAANRRFLPRLLRRPRFYLVDEVLDTGWQPFAPTRKARWEFRFYTVGEAKRELARVGFRTIDAMSVAPVAAYHERIAQIARREKRTWESLLRIEEQVGRRSGTWETGHGFVLAAVKR